MASWWSHILAVGTRSIWWDIIPVSLITCGAALLIWALWRGQGVRHFGRAATSRTPAASSTRSAPDQVLRDGQELATLLAEQMDRQAARLEQLIADADARIRRLERLNNSHSVLPSRPSLTPDATDPLNRRIYELADEGMPSVEIARALQQQTGKVELILALRQR